MTKNISPARMRLPRLKNFVKRIPLIGHLAKLAWRWVHSPRLRRRGATPRPLETKVDALAESATSCYLGNGVVLTRVQGFKMFLPGDDISITPHLLLESSHEPWVTTLFLRLLRPGMTVVDVGANVGYYTLLAARGVGPTGKVYAFEPEPRTFGLLKKNVRVNGLSWVTLCNKAVWKSSGKARLFTTHHMGVCGGHSMIGDPSECDVRPVVTVDTITLDEFLEDERKVDLIKIDAEGAEPFIIEGMERMIATSSNLKALVELSPNFVRAAGLDPVEYVHSLRQRGFLVRIIKHDGTLEELSDDSLGPDADWMEMVLLEK